MNPTQIQRLAAAVNALRPDWPTQSLTTFLHRNLETRDWRDTATAMAWIATDPDTRTPARVLEAGPWWPTVADGPAPASREPRCAGCGRTRAGHDAAEALVTSGKHDFETHTDAMRRTRPGRRPDATRNLRRDQP